MTTDVKQLDDRLNKLEEKLQITFNAIDKKVNETRQQSAATPSMQSHTGVQPHKMAEIEERFNKLEEKLKLTFGEIDKRLTQMQQQPHYSVEDRIQELEDLLLLMQLESTKIREKVGDGLDFGIAPAVPDISERLTRIESEIASHASTATPVAIDDTKLTALEEKINSLNGPVVRAADDSLKETIQALEKKVNTLEALLAQRGRKELEKEESLLSDVQEILRGR